MSSEKVSRREFFKIMGMSGAGAALAGCDMPTTVTLEEGKEKVVAYLVPEEYVIPGVGVWYATVCQQCPAGCGIHGRVREGRILKLEGNPESPINHGKLCQMGQAGLQAHYNPDRITGPMLRKGSELTQVSWDEALKLLDAKVGPKSGLKGDRFAWLSGTVSGHQAVLIQSFLETLGSSNHFTYETVNTAVEQAVYRDTLGISRPRYRIDQARSIFSLGADLVGASESPVHFATEYARFRSVPRGVLIQAEPKMSLTGGNADLWLPVRPGTEGALALGVANTMIRRNKVKADHLPQSLRDLIAKYDVAEVTRITGIGGQYVVKTAATLAERTPSLVIPGPSAAGHQSGYESVAAAMVLNILLGNIGKTIVAEEAFPFPQMAPREGNTSNLLTFVDGVKNKQYDVVFFSGTNPVYTAPSALNVEEQLAKVPFKVAFTMFPDETTQMADLILPMHSAMEDWGTHVSAYQPAGSTTIGVQQPVMEPIHEMTRGFGDVLLDLLKMREPQKYAAFNDYYAYLRNFVGGLPEPMKGGVSGEQLWEKVLQDGMIRIPSHTTQIEAKIPKAVVADIKDNAEYPMYLVPSPRLGLWDGRHANLSWLQEAPDQITKVVWGSWAELHPETAARLRVSNGDVVRVDSAHGSLETRVYIHKGIQKDTVAVPMGQGHTQYGRYAKGRGVNPMVLVDPLRDAKTGELALYGTRVRVSNAGRSEQLVKMGSNETQLGRRLAVTITADQFRKTEGGGKDVA